MSDNSDFALIAWIKRDQEERQEHQEKMVQVRKDEDELYLRQLKELMTEKWKELKVKERQFVVSMVKFKKEGRNFTDAQRSAISGLFYRKYYNMGA